MSETLSFILLFFPYSQRSTMRLEMRFFFQVDSIYLEWKYDQLKIPSGIFITNGCL